MKIEVLRFLKKCQTGVTVKEIHLETGVALQTIRESLYFFEDLGFVTTKLRNKTRKIVYVLNKEMYELCLKKWFLYCSGEPLNFD